MMHHDLPLKAISIQQPWSYLIVTGIKPVENRSWPTSFRGPVAIHAGLKFDRDARQDVIDNRHPVTGEPHLFVDGLPKDFMDMASGRMNSGIVGVAEIVDCVTHHPSDWFVGEYGFVIANARPVQFIPCKGALGLFDWRRQIEKEAA